ncbi:MAG: hypothetical protein IH591_10080, partial [Bacteroidales bacterium]|nr:hypothetical protein [Bacteroidales bacterium]
FLNIGVTLLLASQGVSTKGVPSLHNYSPEQYHNSGKIWDIASAPNGMVYMAADKGMLEYDGKTWVCYKGSAGFTRSILVVNDSVIYTGSDLDFGIWKLNRFQEFEYRSLYPFNKEANEINEEFFNLYSSGENIAFISSRNIYLYKDQLLTKIAAPSAFAGSFAVDDTVYIADARDGVFFLAGSELRQAFRYPENIIPDIAGIYRHKDGIAVVTKNSGILLWSAGKITPLNNEVSPRLRSDKVFSFSVTASNMLAFGTILKGLYITDSEGVIIHHINKSKGLPNNTILSMHYTASGKLWLGMDYGVSSLEFRDNMTYFLDYAGDYGTGYTALLHDGLFYLGTNQGLYISGWKELDDNADSYGFRLIPGSEGQVWTLTRTGNSILMGHDKGLYAVLGTSIQRLDSQPGVWTIIPYKEHLLTGNYNGISIYSKDQSGWEFRKKMDLIYGSCNQLVSEGENTLWVNIPNFGIIRAELDENLYPATREIFPDSIFQGGNPVIRKDVDGIHVITDIYKYSWESNDKSFTGKKEVVPPVRAKGLLPGIRDGIPLNNEYKFYPVYNGFALYYLAGSSGPGKPSTELVIRKLEALGNRERVLLHNGSAIPYRLNNIRTEHIVPNQEEVLYQYRFSDSEEWSLPVPDNTFDFFNLENGEHHLTIRALIGTETAGEKTISFRIAAPRYRSPWAFALYLLLAAVFVYSLLAWQKLLLKRQKKEMLLREQNSLREQAENHRKRIMILEQEKLKAEYEQLKQQLKTKTIELAGKAKDNEEKNKLLLTLKEKTDSAAQNPLLSNMRWGEIRRLLDSYVNVEDNTFEIQMDELHQEFYKRLKERVPGLSNNDLRLCAYLKIGLNSKEIAVILNILPSSAFISRSRLRKKLKLKTDEDLHNFLNSI